MPSEQPTISLALLHQVGGIPGAPGAGPPGSEFVRIVVTGKRRRVRGRSSDSVGSLSLNDTPNSPQRARTLIYFTLERIGRICALPLVSGQFGRNFSQFHRWAHYLS